MKFHTKPEKATKVVAKIAPKFYMTISFKAGRVAFNQHVAELLGLTKENQPEVVFTTDETGNHFITEYPGSGFKLNHSTSGFNSRDFAKIVGEAFGLSSETKETVKFIVNPNVFIPEDGEEGAGLTFYGLTMEVISERGITITKAGEDAIDKAEAKDNIPFSTAPIENSEEVGQEEANFAGMSATH
jgi:hypothetical protein